MPFFQDLFRTERRASRTPSRSRRIYSELEESASEYESERKRKERMSISKAELKPSQRRLDRARAAYRDDEDYKEDRRESEKRRIQEVTPSWYRESEEVKRSPTFPDSASYRRESQYRDTSRYRRKSSAYEPGLYADRDGYCYENTSGWTGISKPKRRTSQAPVYEGRRPSYRSGEPSSPRRSAISGGSGRSSTRPIEPEYNYEEITPTGSKRRRDSTSKRESPPRRESKSRRESTSRRGRSDPFEKDYDDYLDTLTDDEINRRRREAKRALLRFQTDDD